MRDPILHGAWSDVLPEDHPMLQLPRIVCKHCNTIVHACFNNENMCDWVETGIGALCLDCFHVEAISAPGHKVEYLALGLSEDNQ